MLDRTDKYICRRYKIIRKKDRTDKGHEAHEILKFKGLQELLTSLHIFYFSPFGYVLLTGSFFLGFCSTSFFISSHPLH